MDNEEKQDSEFGKGLTYCLGLFLAHAERWRGEGSQKIQNILGKDMAPLWFNGASDHIYELQIPKTLPEKLQERLLSFQSKVLMWGHGYRKPEATNNDITWAVQEAKDLLLEINRAFGVEVQKGVWE